jgi:predicted peptidase
MKRTIRTFVLPFLLYEPMVPEQGKLYPLIIYLHGVGERGTDPLLIEKYCLPKYIVEGLNLESYIYAPLCPPGKRWEELDAIVVAGIEELITEYPINKIRVSITGFSMGAQGLWKLVVSHPGLFRNIAPVAGRIPQKQEFLDRLPLIIDKSIWIFHSNSDKDVDVNNSLTIIRELKSHGASNLSYIIYDGLSHGETADKVYSDPSFYEWILSFDREIDA